MAWDKYVAGLKRLQASRKIEDIHGVGDLDDEYLCGRLAEAFPDLSMMRMRIEHPEPWCDIMIARGNVNAWIEVYQRGLLQDEIHSLWNLLDAYYAMEGDDNVSYIATFPSFRKFL